MKVKQFLNQVLTRTSDENLTKPDDLETGNTTNCSGDDLSGVVEGEKILFWARDEILRGGIYHFTEENKAVELDIDKHFKEIRNGNKDLLALAHACLKWIEVSRIPPRPPEKETVSLFGD